MTEPTDGLENFADALRRSRKLLQALLTEFENHLSGFHSGEEGSLQAIGVTLNQLAKTQIKAQEQKDAVDAHLRHLDGQAESGALRFAEARAEIERRLACLRTAGGS